MFSKEVMQHFQSPRNVGEVAGATAIVEVSNPICGDVLKLSARVEQGRIVQAKFLCKGCTTAIACGSLLTERITGKCADEISALTAETLSNDLGGLPEATFHGAQLAGDAAKALAKKLRS